jgi:hypothetical protein
MEYGATKKGIDVEGFDKVVNDLVGFVEFLQASRRE